MNFIQLSLMIVCLDFELKLPNVHNRGCGVNCDDIFDVACSALKREKSSNYRDHRPGR